MQGSQYIVTADTTFVAYFAEINENTVYINGIINPTYELVGYKQRNGIPEIVFQTDSVSVYSKSQAATYHWGGIGIKDMIDVSGYSKLVVKYKQVCTTCWFLTKNAITDITSTTNLGSGWVTGSEITYDLSKYSGYYYIGMWPKSKTEIEAIYFE